MNRRSFVRMLLGGIGATVVGTSVAKSVLPLPMKVKEIPAIVPKEETGVSMEALFSFAKEEWKTDPDMYYLNDGWEIDARGIDIIRDGGWVEKTQDTMTVVTHNGTSVYDLNKNTIDCSPNSPIISKITDPDTLSDIYFDTKSMIVSLGEMK